MPFGYTHTSLRVLAKYATLAFFSDVQVENGEQVPVDGPLIIVANHWNAAVDPAMLSCFFPHARKLHYWAKSTLFTPGLARTILLDAGNLPVDRRTKDNTILFASTLEALRAEEVVALFPEGGSLTVPGLQKLKDGASWAALEYEKSIAVGEHKGKGYKSVVIAVAGISYTDKAKYRSRAIKQYGDTIAVQPYLAEFLVEPKSAVKKLTAAILASLLKVTVNAPDMATLDASGMARRLLWLDDKSIPLSSLRDIGQLLVDLLSPTASAEAKPEIERVKGLLLDYRAGLRSTGLTHYSLSGVPLPPVLDPDVSTPLPDRFRVLASLFVTTVGSLVQLPLFAAPLVAHIPVYAAGKYALRLSRDEEDFAQNKIALGLVLALVLYTTGFLLAWGFLILFPFGVILAGGLTYAFVATHNRLVDENYNSAKRLVATWRVLAALWSADALQEAKAAAHRRGLELKKLDEVAGEGKGKAVEIRQVLRLRGKVMAELMRLLLDMKEGGDTEQQEIVRKLEGWGAVIKPVKRLDATPAHTPLLQ